MQSKSKKSSSNIFRELSLSVSSLAFVVSSLIPSFASATMTVVPVDKVNLGPLSNSANGVFYYPIYIDAAQMNGLPNPPTGLAKLGVFGPGFNFVDLGQDPNPAGSMQSQDGVIIFNVKSTAPVTGQAVLVATIANELGTISIVPIIGAGTGNGAPQGCFNDNTACASPAGMNPRTGNPFFYGVNISKNTAYQVAISPTAFCESLALYSMTNGFCSNGFFENGGPTGNIEPMSFNFSIYPSTALPPAINGNTVLPGDPADSVTVNMNFETLNTSAVK